MASPETSTTSINPANKTVRTEMLAQVRLLLGEGMIDVEPDPEHFELAATMAFDRYRQRSSNAVEESYAFLELQPDLNEYVLPKEIRDVSKIYRHGVAGLATGGGSYIEPFNLAYTNLYLLQSGQMGGLATYDAFSQYQETVGRLFGLNLNYHFNTVTKRLQIVRRPTGAETVLLHVHNDKPEETLWNDPYVRPWLRDYALAKTKQMIAEARGLFSQIPGPQGGTTLNGQELKADAETMLERLELELTNLTDGQMPMWFTIRIIVIYQRLR